MTGESEPRECIATWGTKANRELIERAAAARGLSVAEFARFAAVLVAGAVNEPDNASLGDAIEHTITDTFARHGHDVTKFVLIAEVVDPHSGAVPPALCIETSNETPLWDSMGLLAYVAGMDHAEIARRYRLAEPR